MITVIKWVSRLVRAIRARIQALFDYLLWSHWPDIAGVQCEGVARCIGKPLINVRPGGEICFGNEVVLVSRHDSNPLYIARPCSLTAMEGAKISVGDRTAMSGTVIVSDTQIKIGENVMIGANVTIIDTDFHPLDPVQRRKHPTKGKKSKPVMIGNDVFIGAGAVILKGSQIGAGCVIGAGALVAGSFSPGSFVAGNPARIIKNRKLTEAS